MAIYDYEGNTVGTVYALDGFPAGGLYDYRGDSLIDYSDYTVADYATASVPYMQGFDILGGVIFQFLAYKTTVSNKMMTINAATGATIQSNITSTSDHGDSASFSHEFYDGDDYPLIYVTADTNPAKVYVNRVTASSCTLIRTLSFPLNKTGYYAALCLNGNTAYMLGYKEDNYQTDDGGANTVIVSKWNLSQLTDNGDGTYTPGFVSSYERAFIYCMQGQQFHDDLLWIASGGENVHGYVYALDPADGSLLHTIDTNTTTELEGLAWLSPAGMVYGLQGGTYKKVTFAEVSNT